MRTVHWRFPLAASVVVLALTAAVGTQSPRPLGIVDLLNLPRVADPQLSPDGRDVLYTRADADWKVGRRVSHIWRAAVGGGEAMQLTSGTDGEEGPRWSPDGKQIAFVSARDGASDQTTDLYVVTLDALQVTRLTNESVDTDVREPSWAPGGKQIAYSTAFDSGDDNILTSDVFVINIDDRQISRLTDGPGTAVQDLAPSWSPDGKQLAFISIRGGNSDIFTMNADGTGVTRLTTSAALDISPAWNR